MRDITEDLGVDLTRPLNTRVAFEPDGIAWDVAIGGLSFLLAPSQQFPYRRQTAQWRRQQLDTTREPGEQSLTGDWLRSQSSFHLGQGSRFFDPLLAGEESENQFAESLGVDVWTPGVVKLLPATSTALAGAAVQLVGYAAGHGWIVLDAGTLKSVADPSFAVTNGPASVVAATAVGSRVYYATATQILFDDLGWGSPTVVGSLSNVTRLAWVKQRLLAFTSTGAIFDVAVSLSTPLYTHPLGAAWTWTGCVDLSSAVFVSGFSGDESTVFAIPLDTSGATPVLDSPVPAVQLPRGEQARSLGSYLGSLLAVGTSQGVRIGVAQGTTVSLGDLSVRSETPVTAFAEFGRWVYAGVPAGVGGVSGLWRVAPGEPLESGLAPAASDLVAPSGTGHVTGITVTAGRVAFSVAGLGLVVQSSSLRTSGWLQTSRIRFNTAEAKLFTSVKIGLAQPGTVSVEESGDGQSWTPLYTTATADGRDVEVLMVGRTGQEASLRFTLTNGAAEPQLSSYVLRAAPAIPRRRILELPLMVMSEERDRKNVRVSRDGWARIQALEELESTGQAVLYQDFITGETLDVTVEQVEFVAVTRPAEPPGWGGMAIVTLRSIR